MSERVIIKEGTAISCPECGKEILRFNTDIFYSSTVDASDVDPIGDTKPPTGGTPMRSPCCNVPYIGMGKIYTRSGWRYLGIG